MRRLRRLHVRNKTLGCWRTRLGRCRIGSPSRGVSAKMATPGSPLQRGWPNRPDRGQPPPTALGAALVAPHGRALRRHRIRAVLPQPRGGGGARASRLNADTGAGRSTSTSSKAFSKELQCSTTPDTRREHSNERRRSAPCATTRDFNGRRSRSGSRSANRPRCTSMAAARPTRMRSS